MRRLKKVPIPGRSYGRVVESAMGVRRLQLSVGEDGNPTYGV